MDRRIVYTGDKAQDNSKKELSKQSPNTNLMQLRDHHDFREADSASLVGTSSLADAPTRSLQSSDGGHHSPVSYRPNLVFDLSPTYFVNGPFYDHQTINEFNDERIHEIPGSGSKQDNSIDKGESSKKRLITEVEKIREMNCCLFIMSNRGSVEYQLQDGKLKPMLGAGGLSTSLHSIKEYGVPVKFVSAPMGKGDREAMDKGLPHDFVPIDEDKYNRYYNKISNKILWFTLHGMCNQVQGDSSKLLHNWKSYTEVNRKFANTVSAEIRKEQEKQPVIMIQDYHLFQVSRMLREEHQNIILQQFIHVPWPEPEVWNVLPQKIVKDIYSGMSGNDIIGFQTKKDANNFLKGAKVYLPDAKVDFQTSAVRCNKHNTQVHFYPISISVDEVRKKANSESAKQNINDEGQKQIKNTQKEAENIHGFPEKIYKILRVDRMDPTKNIVCGFQAYACLLEDHPELREKVIFVACLVPSRGKMKRYQELEREIKLEINKINNRYGNHNWQPIHAFFGNDQARALAEMQSYDTLLVNPNQDGMNLVAKEGVVINQNDGVLILSQTAGAFHELKEGVIPLVSPSNLEETAKALKKALDMSPEERKIKATIARNVVEDNDLTLWLSRQLHDINHITPILPSMDGRRSGF